jgi:hypothetical protein
MLSFSTMLAALAAVQSTPPSSPDFRAAYELAHRCFVVTSGFRDEAGARRAYDAVMRLGHLRNLTNRQLNADFDRYTASEGRRLARDRGYRDQLTAECRTIGLAS